MSTKDKLVANFLLGTAGGIQYLKLKSASKNPRKTGANTLREILEYAKDTVYGKEHNFAEILAAQTDDELFSLWQKNVKPNEYEDFRPYVERHKHGEANVLFPGKPVLYATTSGSTAEPSRTVRMSSAARFSPSWAKSSKVTLRTGRSTALFPA